MLLRMHSLHFYLLFLQVRYDWCNKLVLSSLWDGAYKITLAANQKE